MGELPAHTHTATVATTGAHTHTMTLNAYCYNARTTNHGWGGDDVNSGTYSNVTASAGNHTHTVTLANTGSSTAHNNLQPYRAVYIWRRIN